MNPYFRLLVIAWVGLCCRVAPAAEPEVKSSAAAEINQANALLRTGEIDGALQRYQAIQPPDALRPSLEYNQAVALYRKQDYAAAAELFSLAAGASESQIAGPSHYNLGNCRYAQGLGLAQQDKAAAIAKLQEAIAHYRDALRSLPHDADARANIELAAQLIDQLTQAPDQSQSEQSQPEQSQSEQSQSEQSQSEQSQPDQSQSEQSPSDQSQQKQDQSGGQDAQSEQQPPQQDSGPQPGQQENQESQVEEQNASQSPGTDEDSPQPSSDDVSADEATDQASPSSKEPASQNASAKDRPQDPQAEAAEPTQPEKTPEDAPQSASGQLTAADSDENQDAAASSKALREISADESVMSHEEAMKMLQAIRDRDMLRRFQLRQRDSTRQVPVDRDW